MSEEKLPSIYEVKQWLDREGILYRQPTPHQIKVRSLNYYPNTGSISKDGSAHRTELSGFDTFKNLVKIK
jgi:hypothetical protein